MVERNRSDLATALLIERLVREAYSDRAPGSVTALQWAILRAIDRAGSDGCTQNWIAGFIGVTAAPVNRAIAALERHNAVTRERDALDGRKSVVKLTKTGRSLLENDPIFAITARIARLSALKKVEFRTALQQLFLDSDEEDQALEPNSDRR